MAHVVTLKHDPSDTTVVYLSTPLDMANTMGGFGPARYVGANAPIPGVSYVVARDDLPRFVSYAQHHGVTIVDTGAARRAPRPPWSEAPLPECTHCGQPARRGAHLEHCPNCGAPWQAVEVGTHHPDHHPGLHAKCATCGAYTPVGFAHCTHCGTPHADA